MNPLASLAPAIKDIASAQKTSFATTQAVWRFLNNEKITFKQLNEPIHQLACEQIKTSQHDYALVIHDWSQLQYVTHRNKTRKLQRTHQYDSGYCQRHSKIDPFYLTNGKVKLTPLISY
ncbi:hypothetical protein [Acinetobacter indicus]